MKIFGLLILLLSMSTFAGETTEFSTSEDFKLQSRGRSGMDAGVLKKVSISVNSFDLYERKVNISLNGSGATRRIKKISQTEEVTVYESIVAVDTIEDGFGCSEAESVSYIATIEDGAQGAKVTALKAKYFYSYEICHDFSGGTHLTISYN